MNTLHSMCQVRNFGSILACTLLSVTCSAADVASNPPCDLGNAPDRTLPYKKKAMDTGVVTTRFLNISVSGKPVTVDHGIDVHSDQPAKVSMQRVRDCGGTFVFVRVSGEKRRVSDNKEAALNLWASARQAGLDVFPYHYLGASQVKYAAFPLVDENEYSNLLNRGRQDAVRQAQLFIADLKRVKSVDVPAAKKLSSLPDETLVLDLEEALPDSTGAKKTERGRQQYGLIYSQMACAWIDSVQAAFPASKIILYSAPYVLEDYQLLRVNQVSGQCLREVPLWLAATTAGGGHAADDASPKTRKIARQACFSLSSKKDRCLMHQYTHFGQVGSTQIDLNRVHTSAVPW